MPIRAPGIYGDLLADCRPVIARLGLCMEYSVVGNTPGRTLIHHGLAGIWSTCLDPLPHIE